MRVRCRAAADFRSNTVGCLELECATEGLLVSYQGVSSYRQGYAPGPLTRGIQLCAPWRAVYATRLGEENLLLSLDEKLTPLNRFFLGSFSRDDPLLAPEQRRRRRILWIGAAATLSVTLVIFGLALPSAIPHVGALTTLGIAVSAALLILLLGVAADAGPNRDPVPSRTILAEFSHELACHLPHHLPLEIPTETRQPWSISQLGAVLPRSTVGIAITLTATALAALISTSGHRPTPAVNSIAVGIDTKGKRDETGAHVSVSHALATRSGRDSLDVIPPQSTALVSKPDVPLGADCQCTRHASLLWPRPLPRLSPLVIKRRDVTHGGHQHIELELAAINNGDRSIEKLSVAVVFYESRARAQGQRQKGVERPLYFEGPLRPGRAIKWQVDGRGTSFEVLAPDLGTLNEDGSDAAPSDAFLALTAAHHRPVRLHAAMLLAFLHDPRARPAAIALREARQENELSYLDRVLDTTRDVQVCQVSVTPEADERYRVRSCLYNTSKEALTELSLRIRALDAELDPRSPVADPPTVLAEHSEALSGIIPARSGRLAELLAALPTETGPSARAFEILADRKDLLP